ncbi:MAG: hypothetical protein ABIE74_10495 [Pseudomonadota bacterium]
MKKILCVTLFIFLIIPLNGWARKAPKWTGKVHWEDGGYHYFVGVSTKSMTEELGRREALDNATAEAIQSLFGISGKMDLTSFSTLQKIQVSQDVFVSSDEVNLKAESVDIYVEKIKDSGETKYNVYRSIKVNERDADKELARLKELAVKKKSVEGKVLSPSKDLVAVSVEGESLIQNDDEPDAKAKAIKIGIRRSCEKLMAHWFYPGTLQKNYPRLNSTIYEKCSSFSKNYEVLGGYREDNLYKIMMTVYLNSGDIRRKLMNIGLFRERTPKIGLSSPTKVKETESIDETNKSGGE